MFKLFIDIIISIIFIITYIYKIFSLECNKKHAIFEYFYEL